MFRILMLISRRVTNVYVYIYIYIYIYIHIYIYTYSPFVYPQTLNLIFFVSEFFISIVIVILELFLVGFSSYFV